MKKYLIIGGFIVSAPQFMLIVLNYLTSSETDIVYMLLSALSVPFMFVTELVPGFGRIGVGDVFGFIYLSDALFAALIYFLIGMLFGYFIFNIKKSKGGIKI